MSNATPISNAFIPSADFQADGKFWLTFHNEGTYEAYKNMPNALSFKGRVYIKSGWNSDLCTVHFKEGVPALAV